MSDWPEQPEYIRRVRSPRDRVVRFVNIALTLAAGALVAVFIVGFIIYRVISSGLPQLDTLADYHPNLVTRVLDAQGRLMGEFKYENQSRYLVAIDQIPKLMIDAFVAVEDEHFFEHKGLDYLGIVRAAWENFRAGGISQGASTITMQVCRSLLLTPEKTYERKIKEAVLAGRIERRFSKDEILYLYLNQISSSGTAPTASKRRRGRISTKASAICVWRKSRCWSVCRRRRRATTPTAFLASRKRGAVTSWTAWWPWARSTARPRKPRTPSRSPWHRPGT
ncbi:MAG: transglycosylase domain-containing protein [Deltaproteobacteria bacterium]|nr:transglycosylase domain-containing protein [Deltaproteobacteria bacterium]